MRLFTLLKIRSIFHYMENLFINAAIISVIFLLIKFGEMRLINKENKPLKELVRDAFIVYISYVLGIFILDQISSSELNTEATKIFVDAPGF
jgi:hypothetical protein